MCSDRNQRKAANRNVSNITSHIRDAPFSPSGVDYTRWAD